MDLSWKPPVPGWLLGVLAAGSMSIASCASTSPPRPPPDMPPAFSALVPDVSVRWPARDWYRGFSSAELDELVAGASARNGDLAQARARVAQADARARIAGAAILPSVEADGNAVYLAGRSSNGSAHETDWAALLSASYEIDFWGKNHAASRSAQLGYMGSQAERDTIELTTLAGVADTYFELLALKERLAIAHQNFATAGDLLAVVRARFEAGAATPVELAAQTSAHDEAALAVADLAQRSKESEAALALLVGRAPEGFEIKGDALGSLAEPEVEPGLPAELLTRRPDLVQAEANLRAADADVEVARAAMLPSVSLTAAGGLQNPALNAAVLALPGTGGTLALGGTLVQSIFDHGKLRAQRAEAESRRDELLAAYHTAVLAALGDTEKALSAIRHLDEARPYQTEALAEGERAFAGSKLRYEAGAGDYLTLLDAQRTLYQVRDQAVQYRLARLEARVALCKALGGGWVRAT
jgi:outer membrane protein, multidrug efflux system